MKKFKLTTQSLTTYEGFQWQVGVSAPELSGEGDLCSSGWYHYYHHPLLAVLFNPAHANIEDPLGWEVEATGKHKDDNGIKGGCTRMVLVRQIQLPVVTRTQRTAFAILCAKEVCKDKNWNDWADKWLSGEDRSASASAYAAASAASAASAYAAAHASAYAAAFAASAYAAAHASAYAAASAASAADWNYEKLLSVANEAMRYS